MANQTVRIIAKITGQPDKTAELKSVLQDLVAPTRSEKGCISYQLCQSTDDTAEFVFIEEWADRAAIDAHMKSAHVQSAFAKARPLLAKAPEIRNYSVITGERA